MKIGAIIPEQEEIILNAGKATKKLVVANTGDRPIQVGSHYHFFEVNKLLHFDRKESFGYHLDIPSGTSIRYEPGEEKTVSIVAIGGNKTVYGFNDLTCSKLTESDRERALSKARDNGFIEEGQV